MKNYLKILILMLLLVSCKAKTVYVETHTIDTVKTNTILKITEPKINTLVVDEPCDSLGNLKPISFEISTPKSSFSVKSVENKLIIEEKQDSIIEKSVEKKTVSIKDTLEIREKKVTPKWAWYSLILNVLLLGWTFRKFIKIPL